MAIVPRWARAKVRQAKQRRKKAYISKSVTQQPTTQISAYKDQMGREVTYRETIGYRGHLASLGQVLSTPDYTGGLVRVHREFVPETIWHGYPVEWVAFLSCFDRVPDDQLPPLVALNRKRKKEWQSTIKGQGKDRTHCMVVADGNVRHIYCFIEGTHAYFVYLDKQRNKAYKSEVYTSMHAQFVIEQSHKGHISLEKTVTWLEVVSTPELSAS